MVATRSQFLLLLEPTLRDIRSDTDYPRREVIFSRFYKVFTSKKKTEHDFQYAGLGNFQVKAEGNPVTYSDAIANPTTKDYTHVRRALGYKITQEMIDHDLYGEMRKLEQNLQLAGDDDLEIQGHLLLNSGFGTTDSNGFTAAGYDALALFSTAHLRLDGGTNQANRPSTDANLDWTSLANGITQFMLWKDNRGRPIISRPQLLIVHPNDSLTAQELLRSVGKPGTPNNEINALRDSNLEVLVSPYLTDVNAWFLKGDMADAKWYWDVQPRTAMMDDFELEVIKRKRVHGFSNGHSDWVGFYGTSGTT